MKKLSTLISTGVVFASNAEKKTSSKWTPIYDP